MYNGVTLAKGLSFTKIIGGISKTLQVANQVIPLYQKAKPIIANARSVFGVLKEFNKSNSKTIEAEDVIVKNSTEKKLENTTTSKKESLKDVASPTFFL